MSLQQPSPSPQAAGGDPWPEWSISQGTQLFDQSPIIGILTVVHKQINILNKRVSGSLSSSSDEGLRELVQELIQKVDSLKSDSFDTSKASTSFEQRIKELENSVVGLNQETTSSRTVINMHDKQMIALTKRVDDLDQRLTSLDEKVDATSQSLSKLLDDRLANWEASVAGREGSGDPAADFRQKLHELELKMSHLDDANSVNEMRLKNVEKNALQAFYMSESAKSTAELLESQAIPRVEDKLATLISEKADRSELISKVDMEALQTKAESDEIVRLEEMVNKLHKLLLRNAHDHRSAFDNWDKKNDQKLEFLSEWLLKRVRKEFGGGQMRPEKDGADIGKVKCLVCDQPIHQNRTTDTVFGGPAMIPTMHTRSQSPGGQQRPRSGSPPPADQQHYHNNNNNNGDEPAARDNLTGPQDSNNLKPPRLLTSGDREYVVQVAHSIFPKASEAEGAPSTAGSGMKSTAAKQHSVSMPSLQNVRPGSAPAVRRGQGKLVGMGRQQQPLHLNSLQEVQLP